MTHSDEGSITRSTACPATTVEPGSASRLVTTPSAASQQAHVRPLLAQAGAFGRQALLVLPGRGEVGVGGGDEGVGRRLLLQPGLDRAGADEVLPAQLHVAARIDGREFPAGLGVATLRCLGGGHGAAGAGTEASSAAVRSSRSTGSISGQRLAGFDRVADIDGHRPHPAGRGRPDQVAAPGLDRADAEQLGVIWPSAACTTVTRVGANGPERMTT